MPKSKTMKARRQTRRRTKRQTGRGCGCTGSKPQAGGSAASDRVVQFANKGAASLEDYKHKSDLPGLDDVKSMPVLYQTAGAKKTKSKASKKTKRAGKRKVRRTKRRVHRTKRRGGKKTSGRRSGRTQKAKRGKRGQRGAGFLNMAGCGPVNYPDAGRKYSHLFTKSSTCPGPEFYRNPPGLEKAGSGNGAVAGPGAPYPFK